MADERVRGSELLRQRWSEEQLAGLLEVEHDGVELVDFFPLGIPAPDGGWGVWRVQPEALADLIAELQRQERFPGLRVLRRGIPFPDVFEVQFEAGSARGV